MAQIAGSLEIELFAGLARLQADMDRANKMVGSATQQIERAAAKATAALAGIGIGLGVAEFGSMIKGAIDAADKLNDLSKSTGLAVTQLAGLKLAAKQSGTDLDGVASSINKLSVNIGKDAEKFKALGVTAKDPLEAFKQLSDVFKNIEDPQLRAAVGAQALGKSWASAAPMLMEGGNAIQEMVDKGTKLSGVNQEMATNADKLNDNWELLVGTGGLINRQVAAILPLMVLLSDEFVKNGEKAGEASGKVTLLADAMRGISLVGASVAHAFNVGGIAIGGFAAQMASLKVNSDGSATAIGKSMREEIAKANAEFTALGMNIINAGKNNKGYVKDLFASSGDNDRVSANASAAKLASAAGKSFTGGGGGGKATAEKISEYTRMEEAIAKVNLQATQELANGGKLASSDKFRIEEMQKITFAYATHKISAQERIKLIEQTTAAAEKMAEVEKRAAGIKADQANYADQVEFAQEVANAEVESSKAREQGRAVLIEYSKAIDAENKLTEFEISLIGKSDAARLKALELYRIEIELKKQLAAIDANRGYDESQRIVERAMAQEAAEKAKEGVDLKAKKIELQLELKGYDLASSQLESLATTAGKMGDGFKGATAALSGFSNAFKTLAAAEKNRNLTEGQRTNEQIGAYGEMAGAAKNFFKEGSDGYEAMAAIEKAFFLAKFAMQAQEVIGNLLSGQSGAQATAMQIPGELALLEVKGASAILTQGEGDPYTAFFRMAAMAAIVGAVIASVGGSSSGVSGSGGGGTSGAGNQIGSDGRKATNQGEDMNAGTNYNNATGRYDLQNKPQKTEQEMIDFANAAAIDAAANAVNNLKVAAMKLTAGSEELEQSLMRASIAAGGAGKAQHELATQGMSEAQLATYNYNQALMGQISVQMDIANGTSLTSDNMKELAAESRSLAIELMMASGDIAGARAMARDDATAGYTAEEVAVYDHNQAVRDQIEAANAGASAAREAEAAEQQLAQTRYELSGRLNVLLGRQTQTQFDRATELAATTDAASISMLNLIYQLEDMNAAVDANYATLERSIAAERKIAELRLKGASDLSAALKTTFNAITPALSRATAQSQISMYLALAKAGGVLPTAAALQPALAAISKPSTDLFKTFSEYAIDQARTANDIADLAGFSDKQLTEAQQNIERLDMQLETAKQALDVMRGVDTSVLSVADAVRNFEASMVTLANTKSSAAAFSFSAPTASGGGGGGSYSGGGGGASSIASNPDIDAPTLPEYAMTGWDSEIIKGYLRYYNRYPDPSGYENFSKSNLHGDPLLQAILKASSADKESIDFKRAIKRGYNPLDPIAKFAIGTNYVPSDMMAMVHQGERIIPAAENRELFARLSSPQQNNAELVAELRAIRQELVTVKTELNQIKGSNKKMSDIAEKTEAIGAAPARAML